MIAYPDFKLTVGLELFLTLDILPVLSYDRRRLKVSFSGTV